MTLTLPARFYGTATLDGQPAPEGTEIRATIQGIAAGTGTVTATDSGMRYVVDVTPAQGGEGATVAFTVGGVGAAETGTYQAGAFVQRDLSAQSGGTPRATGGRSSSSSGSGGSPATPPAATVGGTPPATPIPSAAEGPPTGTGADPGTSGAGGTGEGGATARRK